MKFVPNLVGILSIAIYYVVLSFLFSGLFLAFARVSALFGLEPWLLSGVGLWCVLPVGVTLSIWLGHATYRFLLRRWVHAANALHTRRG